MSDLAAAADQLRFLRADLRRQVSGRWWRWISVPLAPGAVSILGFRLSRSAYLAFGRPYVVIHTLLAPVRFLLRPFGARLEIHYTAEVGPGLLILHPGLGAVISGHAIVGRDLVLTGGNCIGGRAGCRTGDLVVGDAVELGVNAVILGPVRVGDRVVVGAGSVVIHDASPGVTLVGQPARSVED